MNIKNTISVLMLSSLLLLPSVTEARPAPVEYYNYPANYHQTTDPLHQHLLGAIDYCLFKDDKNYSIYVSYPELKGTRPLIYNHKPRPAACLIKLFIMEHAFDAIDKGRLDLKKEITVTKEDIMPETAYDSCGAICRTLPGTVFTVKDLLRLMITESDNSAANILIDLLGGREAVNDYITAHGYKDTILRNYLMKPCEPLMPDTAGNGPARVKYSNVTSVRDLGKFFEKLYDGVQRGEKKAVKMHNLLLMQMDMFVFTDSMPQFLSAHKTGEQSDSYTDAGIIYTDRGPIIACILNDNMPDVIKNRDIMRQVAANFYQTLMLCNKGLIVPENN